MSVPKAIRAHDAIKRESERLRGLAEEAYVRSSIPNQPDRALIETLAVEVVETAWASSATNPGANDE